MLRKKKLIWFESEPVITGAVQARARGEREDPVHRRGPGSPYYGPVTIPWAADQDGGPGGVSG